LNGLTLFDRRRRNGFVYAALAAQRLQAESIFMSFSPGGSTHQGSCPLKRQAHVAPFEPAPSVRAGERSVRQ
jgi:hypothetical protein